jgi:hypothetical protein
MFSNCPIVSTDQIARYFTNNQPNKRASDMLCKLQDEKLIEGLNRGLAGKTKVWRLTKKGRDSLGVTWKPIPLTSGKVDHWLGLADCWYHLNNKGQLIRWKTELREKFGDRFKFCADAFFAVRTDNGVSIGFIEYQRTDMTTTRWGEKWAIVSAFMDSEEWKNASFQDFRNGHGQPTIIKPASVKIFVVSHQQPTTIQGGSKLPLTIVRDTTHLG